MPVVRAWEEKGTHVPEPYERIIRILLAPDRNGVRELTFCNALIYPHSQTDLHTHDRPELIYVVSGRGEAVMGEDVVTIEPDVVLWAPAGEKHQVRNTGDDMLKLATVFVPAYTAEELMKGILAAAKRDRKA
ncbi:MAG: cupin domain-containing protein [Bacillota bacterium]